MAGLTLEMRFWAHMQAAVEYPGDGAPRDSSRPGDVLDGGAPAAARLERSDVSPTPSFR